MRAFAQLVSGALILCSMLLSPSSARARVGQEGSADDISAEHKTVLDSWLRQKPGLRLATAEDLDANTMILVKDMFPDRADSPFYVVGDFNYDGQTDFAIGLVINNRPDGLALAVFNGPTGKTSLPAFYDETRFARSDPFFISTDDRGREVLQLGIGSDTKTVLLKPKGKGYYIWTGPTQ